MKRISLEKLAALAQDMYFKNFRHETDFFDEVHFIYLCCTTYAKQLNDMFQEDKKRNKDSDGFSFVNISGPWLITDECEIKEKDGVKYIATSMPTFCFDFDAMASSVHSIVKTKPGQCGDLMRLSNKDAWKIPNLPKTSDIYWYQLGESILLANLTCDPGKLKINYIPAILPENPQCVVAETMADGIITTVLQIMFGAKNETPVVKTANNSNPNFNAQSEMAEQTKNNNNNN